MWSYLGSERMTVYIVTEIVSHDNEQEIRGAFTTREAAQAWIDKQKHQPYFDIEEVVVDSEAP